MDLNMNIAALARSEVRRRAARVERARVHWSWLIAVVALCVACGGTAAVEHSADDGASFGASSVRGPSCCEIQAVL